MAKHTPDEMAAAGLKNARKNSEKGLKTIGRSRNQPASALSRSVLEFRPPQNKCLRSGGQTELLEVWPRVECRSPADREEWSKESEHRRSLARRIRTRE
jgi:hypothetical protein